MDPSLYYHAVIDVTQTWDKVKRIKNYEFVMGKMIFQKLFQLSTDIDIHMFPFVKEYDSDGDFFLEDETFLRHASNFVRMLDLAIHMLGPDMEMVEETLLGVGESHIKYGVMPKHYPAMGTALLETLQSLLGSSFTDTSKDSWRTIYSFFSNTMTQGAYEFLCRAEK